VATFQVITSLLLLTTKAVSILEKSRVDAAHAALRNAREFLEDYDEVCQFIFFNTSLQTHFISYSWL